jgi:hypothetical protein
MFFDFINDGLTIGPLHLENDLGVRFVEPEVEGISKIPPVD